MNQTQRDAYSGRKTTVFRRKTTVFNSALTLSLRTFAYQTYGSKLVKIYSLLYYGYVCFIGLKPKYKYFVCKMLTYAYYSQYHVTLCSKEYEIYYLSIKTYVLLTYGDYCIDEGPQSQDQMKKFKKDQKWDKK